MSVTCLQHYCPEFHISFQKMQFENWYVWVRRNTLTKPYQCALMSEILILDTLHCIAHIIHKSIDQMMFEEGVTYSAEECF